MTSLEKLKLNEIKYLVEQTLSKLTDTDVIKTDLSIDNILDLAKQLNSYVRYVKFDLEATRRERDYYIELTKDEGEQRNG